MRRKDNGRNYVLLRLASVAALLMASIAANMSSISAASSDCLSPRTTSPTYTGDQESGVDSTNSSTWRMGTLAITTKPSADVIVGFRSPTDPNWHDSKPVSSKSATRILLKIGTGDVQFSTQYRASVGSAACTNAPATTFSPSAQALNDIKQNTTEPQWLSSATNGNGTNTNGSAANNGNGSSSGSTSAPNSTNAY